MVIAFHAVCRVILCSLALGSALLACHHEQVRTRVPDDSCSSWSSDRGECTGSIEVIEQTDPLMAEVRFDYRWAGENASSTRPARWAWLVPREQLDELRATLQPRMACERWYPLHPTLREGCTPVVDHPDGVKYPDVPIEARDRICPRSLSAPLNPEIADLDPSAVTATFLAEHGTWHRTLEDRRAAAPNVQVLFTSGVRQVQITVRDMIHECTGENAPNTMLATEHKVGALAIPRRMMSATSAVLIEPVYGNRDRPRELVMWIAGRCRISVIDLAGDFLDSEHTLKVGLSDEDLATAGEVIDAPALQRVCAARAHR